MGWHDERPAILPDDYTEPTPEENNVVDNSGAVATRGRDNGAYTRTAPAPTPAPAERGRPADSADRATRAHNNGVHEPNRAAANNYVLIYGKKGQGKTTFMRELYRARIAAGGSGTVVDVTGTLGDLGTVVRSPAGWWRAARAAVSERRAFSIVVQPTRGVPLDPLWGMVYEVGHSLLAIDEAERYANAHSIDPELSELVSLGRNQQVDIITTVRTPPELHGRLRGNADVVISFAQPSARYAKILNKEFFQDPRVPELLLQLEPFHYLRAESGNVTAGRFVPPWERKGLRR